ncbi:PRC-barrel domain-containing protein [Cereibacter sphaeroides]|uniref:PRC-barrel domain-containing protein n=1 Tax=Cereibacter sphaeroides TaxID=1063 RepID=UPI001F2410FB|nr:PRC-barrel domain-containing protein [Cereibacter sphaeroides]MCE6961667.1 PRC-barrel domain-containing protein [Cereibacter sphaeroides]MCE6975017.1 PRC-barrel domain-containing protein [Cereibacter sphaeroides]
MKKMIALSALLASTTAFAALAQDATTPGTTPTSPATGTDTGTTTTPAPDATTPGTMTGDDAATTTPPATTGTGMTGTDTAVGGEGMQVPEGFSLYAGEPMTAEDLQDADVFSMNDESVSNISDFVLAEDGKIEQVIFDVGGFLGIGARNVAVPFEDLKIYTNQDQSDVRVYVPMSRDELEALPEYTAVE